MWQAAPPQNCSPMTKTRRRFRLLCPQWAVTARNARTGHVSNRRKGCFVAASQHHSEFSFDHSTKLEHSPPSFQLASDLQATSQILQKFWRMPRSLCMLSWYYYCFFFTITWWFRVWNLFLQSQSFNTTNVFKAPSSQHWYYYFIIVIILQLLFHDI